MANIRNLKGIGEAKAKLFAALDIESTSDLLHYYPRTYSDRRKNAPLSSFKNIEDICAPFKVLSAQGIKARVVPFRVARRRRANVDRERDDLIGVRWEFAF